MTRFHTILCPTDFSPTAALAFGYAADLARAYDARLVVLHAFFPAVLGEQTTAYLPDEVKTLRAEAQKQLDALGPADPAVRVERLLREAPDAAGHPGRGGRTEGGPDRDGDARADRVPPAGPRERGRGGAAQGPVPGADGQGADNP